MMDSMSVRIPYLPCTAGWRHRGVTLTVASRDPATLLTGDHLAGKAHGTGLGLSICKKIIEDHKGRIWARNEPGRGAVFAFALPLP